MQALSVQKVGGIAAVLVALFTVLFALFALLALPGAEHAAALPWTAVAADYALAMIGLCGLAVVPAVAERVTLRGPGWMRWTSSLARLGFAVLAVVSVWQAEYEWTMTNASLNLPSYSIEDGAVPMPVMPEASYDGAYWQALVDRAPKGWLEVAAVGLWMLSVGWLARGSGLFPEDLNSVGRVAGLLSFCVPAGALFQVDPLLTLGIASSFVANPLWFGWTGLVLLRSEVPLAQQAQPEPVARRRAKQLARFLHLRRDRHPASRSEAPCPPPH